MDQYLNNQSTELLWDLLASPADKDAAHMQNLQQLVNDHPQSGILHALLTYAGESSNLQKAAAYYNPKALYKLNKDIEGLHHVSGRQLLSTRKEETVTSFFHAEEVEHRAEETAVPEELPALTPDPALEAAAHPVTDIFTIDSNAPVIETIQEPQALEKPNIASPEPKPVDTQYFASSEPKLVETQPFASPEPKPVETQPFESPEPATVETQPLASPVEQPKPEPVKPIEEDTFDEIVSIDDINLAVQEYYASVVDTHPGTYEAMQFSDIYAEALKGEGQTVTPINEIGTEPVTPVAANPLAPEPAESTPLAPAAPVEETAAAKEETLFKDRKVDLNDEAEKLILNNIAATDFFVFDRAFGEKKKEEAKTREPQPEPVAESQSVETQHLSSPEREAVETQHLSSPEPEAVETQYFASPELEAVSSANAVEAPAIAETPPANKKIVPYKNISKYHDEKMPYSFMWWLDKTRKEHSGIYQPFVEFKLDTTQVIKEAEPTEAVAPVVEQPDELQQQYIESIFQLNTVEELEGTEQPPVEFDHKKKEDEIIERFIQEVPQIRPQSADKLDNENKARKSSEDRDELVTETLAQIYIDQMLYPKAIETYKKLMLTYPEKSRYFAGQIDALQKK